MPKSIFYKMLVPYIFISIIGLSCISIAAGYLFYAQAYKTEKELLLQKAQRVAGWSDLLLKSEITKKDFDDNLKSMEITENIKVALIKKSKDTVGEQLDFKGSNAVTQNMIDEIFEGNDRFATYRPQEEKNTYVVLGIPLNGSKGINEIVFLSTSVEDTSDKILDSTEYNNAKSILLKTSGKIKEWAIQLDKKAISRKDFDTNIKIEELTNNIKIKFMKKNVENGGEKPEKNTPGSYMIIEEAKVKAVLSGKSLFYKSSTRDNNSDYLVYGLPLKEKKGITSAIFLYSSVEKVNKKLFNAFIVIFVAFLSISLPTLIVIYILSKRFTHPLINISNTAKQFSKGDFKHRLMIKRDDEIGELAISLNSMAEKVQQLESLRNDFISNISHELKSPLTTIRANTQGILEGVIGESEIEQYLRVNLDETKRLSTLVNELIELSCLDSSNIKLDIEETDISALLVQTIKQMEIKALNKKQTLSLELNDNISGQVDNNRIKQVVINLLDNAIKFTPEKGEIRIIAYKIDEILHLEVEDTGCGIHKEHLPFIFERFYKVSKEKGTGIGLYITKNIIDAHGGEISVYSKENKGAKFTVKLPL